MTSPDAKDMVSPTENAVTTLEIEIASPEAQIDSRLPKKEEQREARSDEGMYMSGWRLHVICFELLIATFLVQMESSITSTAMLDITDHLGGYNKSSWLFTSYLITCCGKLTFTDVSSVLIIMQGYR
jgi:hypothetical protein